MANPISKKQLQTRVDELNRELGTPVEPYRHDGGHTFRAQVGNFHLDYANGGVCLVQMAKGGGECDVIPGRYTKRELWDRIGAMLTGIQLERVNPNT